MVWTPFGSQSKHISGYCVYFCGSWLPFVLWNAHTRLAFSLNAFNSYGPEGPSKPLFEPPRVWPVFMLNLCTITTQWISTTRHCWEREPSDGLVQERCNSSALTMELRLSCTNPVILGMGSRPLTNEKQCYTVTLCLIGWAHTQIYPCWYNYSTE